MAASFEDILEKLKNVIKLHDTTAAEMEKLIKDSRYSNNDKRAAEGVSEISKATANALREVLVETGALAVAHSNADFEEIIRLIGK